MIGFIIVDLTSTINLFNKNKTEELVGHCHLREREFHISTFLYLITVS